MAKGWSDRPWSHLRHLLVESFFQEEARMATGERVRQRPLRQRHNYLFEPSLTNLVSLKIDGDVCDAFDFAKNMASPCPGLLEAISRQKFVQRH